MRRTYSKDLTAAVRFRLPAEVDTRLDDAARLEGCTKSELVRVAIAQLLETQRTSATGREGVR